MSELKHCPCGGSAKLLITDGVSESYSVFDDVTYTKVICAECSFSADDVDDWNTRAPQSEWVSVDDFNPTESCYVHACCNDIVNGWVELLHVYVCPEYGNHTIEALDGEDYAAIVTHVHKINKPEPPKC